MNGDRDGKKVLPSFHGVRRTNNDKRRQVGLVFEVKAEWSDREIARHCGVHHQMVAKLRKTLLDDSSRSRTYTRNGQVQVMDITHIGASPDEPAETATVRIGQ